ncbi:MAG: MOSC domain-containing protein [Rubrobacter sp.]|nr:MOSC domain-containing protein [Rubrobacter sp.]
METPSLASLHVYPIKSCAGTSVDSWRADPLGLVHDRRWMLTDEEGVFLSQRELPRMSLIKPEIKDGHLSITAPDMPPLEVPFEPGGSRILARVWGDIVEVAPTGDEAGRWFSEFLRFPCRLVHLPEDSIRRVDPDFANPEDRVHLADGFPFLLISEASLGDLNSRLDEPLPMNRFRPNLVVRGVELFAEDGWKNIRIGDMRFRVAKPCARCAITTVNQTSGTKGKEPLTTLAAFRKVNGEVMFGQNLIHESPGVLRVGGGVEVL